MGNEVEKTAECLQDNKHKQAHAIPSLRPLHYCFRSHGRNTMKEMPVLLKNGPKFHWHCERDANVRDIGEDRLQVLLPCFRGPLSAARTESRFPGMED